MTVLEIAKRYAERGLSVFPIMADGSKSPCASWASWQKRIAAPDELDRMFRGTRGIAVACGAVSGNREVIDVDDSTLVKPFEERVRELAPGLLERLSIVATPRDNQGCRHYCFGLADPPTGNTKLALSELRPQWNADGTPQLDREGKQKLAPKTLIETRGEGGYVLLPGSPGRCHPSGLEYKHISGPPVDQAPIITAEEHSILWAVARSLNRYLDVTPAEKANDKLQERDGQSPGDSFEASATWEQILEPEGWVKAHTHGPITYWRRPGKSRGWSGTTGCKSASGRDLFCVFSSNAHPFDGANGTKPCTAYSKFAAYAVLNHRGDFKAAAKALADHGHGDRRVGIVTTFSAGKSVQSIVTPECEGPAPVVIRLSDVEAETIDWLWRDRIALGKVTNIAGDPGLGKSFLSLDIAARVTSLVVRHV